MLLGDRVKCMHTLAESAGSNRRKKKLEREKCKEKYRSMREKEKNIFIRIWKWTSSHNLVTCIGVTEKLQRSDLGMLFFLGRRGSEHFRKEELHNCVGAISGSS